MAQSTKVKFRVKEQLLNGKLITSRKPVAIGDGNFSLIQNMRYTDSNPKGIKGHTRLTTLATRRGLDTGDFAEDDTPTRLTITDSVTVTLASLDNDEQVQLYKDFGSGYFGGSFKHYVRTQSTADLDNADTCGVWALTNDASTGGLYAIYAASGDFLCLRWVHNSGQDYLELMESNGGAATSDVSIGLAQSTNYYILIQRNESEGTYGKLYAYIYSNATMSTLVDTLSVTLTEKEDFRYYFWVIGWLEVGGGAAWSGVVADHAIMLNNIKSGYHFRKSFPSESHVLVQAYDETGTDAAILTNDTAIPSAGNFNLPPVLVESGSPNCARWSKAPGGKVCMCDGKGSYIWGGDEDVVGAFITSTDVISDVIENPKDYTDRVSNTIQSTSQSAMIGGGNDSNTILLAAFDGTDDDTSDYTSDDVNAHTLVQEGTAKLDNENFKFGPTSAWFDGNSDYYHAVDSHGVDDWWYMGNNPFTIDFWMRIPDTSTQYGIFQQDHDVDNHVQGYVATQGRIIFRSISGGVQQWTMTTPNYVLTPNVMQHIAIVRTAANGYINIYVDGSLVKSQAITSSEVWPDMSEDFEIGRRYYYGGPTYYYFSGWIDEFRFSDIPRWLTDFSPPSSPYEETTSYWLVGASRPLQGVKFYILTPNTVASTLTVKEWNGSSWSSLTVTDNTTSASVSMAQTGTVTWNTTEGTSRIKYLDGKVMYWYQFYLSSGECEVYMCTVNAPMQTIKDNWDGIEREVLSAYVYEDSVYKNVTYGIYEDMYDVNDAATYVELDALVSGTEYLLLGFIERSMGFNVSFVRGKYNNTASTNMSVYYWNGANWVLCGGLVDGTQETTISFSQDGTVTWMPPDESLEFKCEFTGEIPLYYYKVVFNQALGADVQIYYVSGIPAQKTVRAYSYPVFAANSLWLMDEIEGRRNKILKLAQDSSSIVNGEEVREFYVGDDNPIIAGVPIYLQLGSSIYEALLITKMNETWMIISTENSGFVKVQVSENTGCTSAATMKMVNIGSLAAGSGQSYAIWQASSDYVMFNGRGIVPVSDDIKNLFESITSSMMCSSASFIDNTNSEIHWLMSTGSSTGLDTEYFFDMKRAKWSTISRNVALQCGIECFDEYGNAYAYGCAQNGHLYRLEYGTSFDGVAISHIIKTGDLALDGGHITETEVVRKFKLLCMATNTTSQAISLEHYKDGSTTADATKSLPPQAAGKTIASPMADLGSGRKTFHSFKMSISTDDEVCGFEPIAFAVYFNEGGQDT